MRATRRFFDVGSPSAASSTVGNVTASVKGGAAIASAVAGAASLAGAFG